MTKGKLIKLTLCGVVVGGLLLLGWQRWQYSNAYVSTDNAELNGVIIPVRAKQQSRTEGAGLLEP